MIEGQSFTVTGSTDYPVCDCCGKTNLTRAVAVTNEHGEEFNVGCICASKLMRQVYQGKRHKLSPDAVLSIGKRASASAAWKQRNGWSPQRLVAA